MSQNVNMSLLRLVHQLITVVDNITKTNAQLKKQKKKEARTYKKTHRYGLYHVKSSCVLEC